MIKRVLKVAFVVAIAMVAGINVYNSQKTEVLSDVAMANVEALASGEGQPGSVCYAGYSSCLFWNCMYLFICEIGCPTKKVDEVYNKSTCL